jgi:hypothetical protein
MDDYSGFATLLISKIEKIGEHALPHSLSSREFMSDERAFLAEGMVLGILDSFRRRKKNPAVDDDAERHHVEAPDYFEEEKKSFAIHCPECAKVQKHVHLVETEGEEMECPECHYVHEMRRI